MSIGKSKSSLESDIQHEIRRLSRNIGDDDIRAISSAVAEAIYKNNHEIERELKSLRNQLHSR